MGARRQVHQSDGNESFFFNNATFTLTEEVQQANNVPAINAVIYMSVLLLRSELDAETSSTVQRRE